MISPPPTSVPSRVSVVTGDSESVASRRPCRWREDEDAHGPVAAEKVSGCDGVVTLGSPLFTPPASVLATACPFICGKVALVVATSSRSRLLRRRCVDAVGQRRTWQ